MRNINEQAKSVYFKATVKLKYIYFPHDKKSLQMECQYNLLKTSNNIITLL